MHQELREVGFHGRAAAHKPEVTTHNVWSGVKRRHWTLEMWKHLLWSDESCFTIWKPLMDEFGFGG